MKKLGLLEKIDLREFWQDEAKNFTPWLASEENLRLLSETLDLELEVEDTEVYIGNFKADIIANDIINNYKVIIENQLEKTNHDHLGKIITYASGIKANIIIWIAQKFTEEHRKAIDWLNENTFDEIGFFGLEIELWKIGESLPAPKFNIVSSPNEWAKTIKNVSNLSDLTEIKSLQLEFWNKFKEYFQDKNSSLNLRKPGARQFYNISIGHSKISVTLTVNTQINNIGCEIYIRGIKAKEYFDKLILHREIIENQLGYKLDWQKLENKQDSRIRIFNNGDIRDKENWPNLFYWLKEKSENMHSAFSPYIGDL